MLQTYYPEKTPVEIQKSFGRGFSESLVALSPGQWHGPIILSGYGVHLVYVRYHVTAAAGAGLWADCANASLDGLEDWTRERS